jgi:hypothetical protein
MEFSRVRNIFVVLMVAVALTTGASFALQNSNDYFTKPATAVFAAQQLETLVKNNEPLPVLPPQKLSNPPEIIKAVYVTGWSAGTKKYLNYLSELFKSTEINSVVVDIKDYSGFVSYASDADEVKKYKLYNNAISDIDALVRFFHDKNIYVIGRISVFEDPGYAKTRPDLAVYNKSKTLDLSQPVLWKDNHGLSWLDPASSKVWDYNVSLAKDVLKHGFDEVNFDYVRFPSDGKIENMGFPVWDGKVLKHEVIKNFFKYLRSQLPDDKISIDLFGQTAVNTDDMGIGQLIEDAFKYADYISPMVYPSHYADGFMGFSNPADHPYEVVKYSMQSAVNKQNFYIQEQKLKIGEAAGTPAFELQLINASRLAKYRPWLQDFDMGANYTSDMVKQEIAATQEALGDEFCGFMLWNPSNIYSRGAVLKPN